MTIKNYFIYFNPSKMIAHKIFSLTVLISTVQCLPRMEEVAIRNLNSTNDLGSFGTTESNATAHGLGSTVEISGIVSGDTSSTSGLTSSPITGFDFGNSVISSQGNCSELSSSSAQGSTQAEGTVSGSCLFNINMANAGFPRPGKVAIGMEGQAAGPSNQTNNTATITQSTSQNPQEGSAEAYQLVYGPLPTSSFSGVMGIAAQQEQILAGTSETMMTHAIGTGATYVETIVTPYVPQVDITLLTDQLPKVAQ